MQTSRLKKNIMCYGKEEKRNPHVILKSFYAIISIYRSRLSFLIFDFVVGEEDSIVYMQNVFKYVLKAPGYTFFELEVCHIYPAYQAMYDHI